MERQAVAWAIYQTDRRGRGEDAWQWLCGTGIKKGTKSLIMAAQEQAIRTCD